MHPALHGLGIDFTPWTNAAASIATSASQVEVARQARIAAQRSAPVYNVAPAQAQGGSPSRLILLAVLGLGAAFVGFKLLGRRKSRR